MYNLPRTRVKHCEDNSDQVGWSDCLAYRAREAVEPLIESITNTNPKPLTNTYTVTIAVIHGLVSNPFFVRFKSLSSLRVFLP